MSSTDEIEKQPKRSPSPTILQKMNSTLAALGKAFSQAMDLPDPMDRTHHEIGKVNEADPKRREFMEL